MKPAVPFNDTSRIFRAHESELLEILSQVAASGWWLLGERTEEFSKNFSEFCGTDFCLPVGNGTDALEIALRSVIVNPKTSDEVITVANAGGYSTTACYALGVTPVYADIEPDTQLIDIDSLIRCLAPSVRAIVITHLYGGTVNIPEIRSRLSGTRYSSIPIIEDCAQAHGARFNNHRVGSLGDLATFSFYPTKNLGAMGDAGAIVTSDPDRFQVLQQLHQYGWKKKYDVGIPYGKNSRMDEIQAGILNHLLPYLDSYNLKRKEILRRYQQYNSDNISFLDYSDKDFVAHLAVAKVDNRDRFLSFMKKKNIAIDIHYPILDTQQNGWKNLPKRQDNQTGLKVSEASIKKVVSMPCFPFLKDDEIDIVCEALHEWQSK